MTKEEMVKAAEAYEDELRKALAARTPDLTDKQICHLLCMRAVKYENEVQEKSREVQKLQIQIRRLTGPLRLLKGGR